MSDIVIKAENLGKKYVIGHQAERGGYTALRDVLMQNARTLWNKTKDLATGKPIIQGDTMEEVWALKDVSFEIRRGEAVGIIGRNGAGKSTLLKILSRITEPSTGRVTIKGRVASLLEVGTGFHPELSGRENIYLNGTILGMTRVEIKQKFDEIVAFAEVERYLDTPVKRYSSGMYVRLAFAVAAHLEPEILVVDEVLAVGDASFQKKCLGKMGKVAKEGRTVLFVSHNMSAIKSLCNRGIYINQGRTISSRNLDECISLYNNHSNISTSFWEGNIGDSDVRLYRVSIKPVNSEGGIFFRGEKAIVEIEYELLKKQDYLIVGVEFYNRREQLIALSRFSDYFDDLPQIKYPGKYTVYLEIDLGIFYQGDYYLNFNIGIHNIKRIIEFEPTLFFSILLKDKSTGKFDTNTIDGMIYPNNWNWHI